MAQVDHHPVFSVDRSPDGDLYHVVVAVVGHVVAEDLVILLLAPIRAAQHMSGGEGGAPGDARGGGHGSIRKLAPESGADSEEANQTMIRETWAGRSAGPSTPAMRSI